MPTCVMTFPSKIRNSRVGEYARPCDTMAWTLTCQVEPDAVTSGCGLPNWSGGELPTSVGACALLTVGRSTVKERTTAGMARRMSTPELEGLNMRARG